MTTSEKKPPLEQADCTEAKEALRNIATMREDYGQSQKEMEQWEEEQWEEEASILQLVEELEQSPGINGEDLSPLTEIRDIFRRNQRQRATMREEWEAVYKKKNREWDEEESKWQKQLQQQQEGNK